MERLVFCLLISLGLILYACDKEEQTSPDSLNDFRSAYVGDYQVVESVSSYGFPECGDPYSWEKDTIISVEYGNSDSTLKVLGREVLLDSNGSYSAYHYGLRMWNDSINSNFMNGGLGCGLYEGYVGYNIN